MSIVARVYRGNLVDLTHIGHIAVVDYTGKLLYSYGDPNRVTFVRSSSKPMQVIPVYESGAIDAFGISEKEVALICGSHSGESFHVESIRSILKKSGLDEGYLQCGTHWPFAEYAAQELRNKGLTPEFVHNNCSGKHSGMLITAKYLNEDMNTYYQPDHPVQRRIIKTISEICEYDQDKIITAVDGCGVPVFAMPLYKFAYGYARLAKPQVLGRHREQTVQKITGAMTSHPEMVAGTGRICTDLMRLCGDRLFAKVGANAYYAIGLKDRGIGITMKMEGGESSILEALVLNVLRKLDVITSDEYKKLEEYYLLEVKNHRGEIVGHTEIDFDLVKEN